MHRNTRDTLKEYYRLGLLDCPPTRRCVEDIVFDFQDEEERRVYDAVGRYINKRYEELEREKPGKGFVMTVYRRRAASSPLALERSLERRRDGLRQVANKGARHEDWLSQRDVPENLDLTDLPESEAIPKVSTSLPQDPQTARVELDELDRPLQLLKGLQNRDTKRDRFFEALRQITEDGRAALVFTEYQDNRWPIIHARRASVRFS